MEPTDMLNASWRKSSYSGSNGDCVEAANLGSNLAVRDSQAPDGPRLAFPSATWQAFAADLKRRA